MNMKKINIKGMTLVEVTFAMTIFAIMIVAMMTYIASVSEGVAAVEQTSDIERDGNRVLEKMCEMLRGAFVPGDAPADWVSPLNSGADSISFLVPVDHDGDGDTIDSDLEGEWGAIRYEQYTPGQFLDLSHTTNPNSSTNRFYTTFSFVQSSTFSESSRNIDMNLDGDTSDTFRIGHIEKSYPSGVCSNAGSTHNGTSAPAWTNEIVGNIIIVGDFDNDGSEDPIFALTGSRLTITLNVCDVDEVTPILRTLVGTVELRNMQ
jgi:type II secretory pathway pseudopilin PulG